MQSKARSSLAAQLSGLWLLGGRGEHRLGKYVRDDSIEAIWETQDNFERRAEINIQLRKALGFN